MSPSATDEALWRSARSLEELGELTARWLEGTLSWIPTYGDSPDPETGGLVHVLVSLNRAGFVTDFSQPGIPISADGQWGQRASVSGYCDERVAEQITRRLDPTDLVVLRFDPFPGELGDRTQVAVTLDEGVAYTWQGFRLPAVEVSHQWGGYLSSDALEAIDAATELHILDPVWGRNDLLWPTMLDAVSVPR